VNFLGAQLAIAYGLGKKKEYHEHSGGLTPVGARVAGRENADAVDE
jgi:hypothetical protein